VLVATLSESLYASFGYSVAERYDVPLATALHFRGANGQAPDSE
jgi:hypothetical protein